MDCGGEFLSGDSLLSTVEKYGGEGYDSALYQKLEVTVHTLSKIDNQ